MAMAPQTAPAQGEIVGHREVVVMGDNSAASPVERVPVAAPGTWAPNSKNPVR